MTFDLTPFRELYPFESRCLDVGGFSYRYVDEGAGEPVVCVHGNPSWSFFFRNVVTALRDAYRVIAVDHIGCGLSDKPDAARYPYTLSRRIDDLEACLDHLGLTKNVTLVLHDWGGMIGMGAALRRPERIARVVLLNTAAFLLPPDKRLPLRLRMIRDTGLLGAILVQGFNAFAYGATKMATVSRLPHRVKRAYLAPYDTWSNRVATLRFVQDIPLRKGNPSYEPARWVDDRLHLLAGLPTLICWGERDFVFDDAFLREWRRRVPDAEVHTFPDAGHYCLEDAGDRIVPLIRSFLERHPAARMSAGADRAIS